MTRTSSHSTQTIDRNALRLLLLDTLPLVDDIALQQSAVAASLQQSLLDAYVAVDALRCAQYLERTLLLLTLACDLGCIDDLVCSYVRRSLQRLISSMQ